MRVLLHGYYGFGNLGDDVLMMTSFKLLKEKFPNAEFFVFANFSCNLLGFNRASSYNNYIHSLLQEEVKLIDWTYKGHFELVFNGGGGIYFDNRSGNIVYLIINKFSYFVGSYWVYKLDAFLRNIFKRRRRITFDRRVGIGLGLGPFSESAPSFFKKVAEIGSYNKIVTRDKNSAELLRKLSFVGEGELSSDIVFLRDLWLNASDQMKRAESVVKNNIGIILMDFTPLNETYYENIKYLVNRLREKKFNVTFFSFDINHDKHYLKSFKETINSWDPEVNNLEDFLNSIAHQDLLLTARAHGAIIGACLEIPSICLGISQKLKEVSNMLALSSHLIDIPFEPEEIIKCINKIVGNYPLYKKRVREDRVTNENKIKQSLVNLFD